MSPTKRAKSRAVPKVREGQGSTELTREEFERRLRQRFYDPAFAAAESEIDRIVDVAWTSYIDDHKSPRTRPAGPGFADPSMDLPLAWLRTRDAIRAAERRHRSRRSRSRILLVCGSARSDESCPGEMSKTFRLVGIARKTLESARGFEVDLLDLSHLTAEYGRVIYPCKGCVSTAMPLCHWPCSCYPNHALGQVQDWMNELYPRWIAAHGVMIVSPVYWYQVPSVLKLMMDRLVCADGGNPDPTSTAGKDPKKAKALELRGWSYPRHLAGRAFSVIVHGDAAGVDTLRRSLSDWLLDMQLVPAAHSAEIGRYVGYYEPYARSHEALDEDSALHEEVRNAARALVKRVRQIRSGSYVPADAGLVDPRPK